MSAPAPRVLYRVSRTAAARLRVEARVVPAGPVSVLTLRDSYGPARGFAAAIENLTVEGTDVRAAIEPGKVLVASSSPFVLRYDCVLPDYADTVSLLRGFRRGGALFCLGMALFHRLHDADAGYALRVDGVASLSAADRHAGAEAAPLGDATCAFGLDGGMPRHYADAAALERDYFVFGDFVVRATARTHFVHASDFPFTTGELMERWPRLLDEVARIFADDQPTDWTAFLFASGEHAPSRPGAGFAVPGGALISVSARDDALASSQTLWLLLHEWTHQWLGEAIGRADPADDWFFEGFTNFVAGEALARAGGLSDAARARLASVSRRAVRRAKNAGEPALAHRGFLGACRWHRRLCRKGSSLDHVLAALVARHRGRMLHGDALLTAIADASPNGVVPDFIVRLAANEPGGPR